MANKSRLELQSLVFNRLAEVAGFHTADDINQWLRDGVIDVSIMTEPLEATAQATTITGTGEYNLPADYLTIKSVFYKDANGIYAELDETTFQQLWHDNPNWEDSDNYGLPASYYWRGDFIGLFPIPSATYSGSNKLRILYGYAPPDFGGDNGNSGLPAWFDQALVTYAVWRARLKDRDETRAQLARADYDIAAGQAATLLNKHRKETAPRLVPDQSAYRDYYQSGGRSYIGVASP